jgi:hypothetical protein
MELDSTVSELSKARKDPEGQIFGLNLLRLEMMMGEKTLAGVRAS